MKSPATALSYRADIDGLRALAVLAVVGFHAGVSAFGGGFTGVDVFFVLSGYLISGIIIRGLERETFSFRDFYSRRIRRIFPALIVCLLGVFVLGWYLLFRVEFLSLGRHIAAGATFLSNAALVQETGYFDVAAEKKPLLHLWSLAIEEQFYLIWPLLLFLSWRSRPRFFAPAIVLGIVSYLLAITAAYTDLAATAFYLPFTRLWELVAGFALFAGESRTADAQVAARKDWKAWIGLALVLLSIFFLNARTEWPGPWTLMPVVGTVLLISAGPDAWVNRTVLANRPMVWIGLISYPLYLWHWPLLAFVRLIQPGDTSAVLIWGAVALSFALAFLTYKLIEYPIRTGTLFSGNRSLALVAMLALIGMLGNAASLGKIPVRLDNPRIQAIQAAISDWNYPGGGLNMMGAMRVNTVPGSADTVLFAGDSHMEQYWPRIDFLVRSSAGMPTALFITERACPTLPGVGRVEVSACATLYSRIMKQAESPGVKTVVLNSYWDDFFRRRLLFRLDDKKKTPIELGTPQADSLFSTFETDLRKLVSAGKKVFVVLTIPIGANDEFNPRAWLPSRLHPNSAVHVEPTISKQEYLLRTAPVLSRVRTLAERAGATVLDPVEYLCPAETCPKMDSAGNPLYMDGRHLRASVARQRATWMDVTLR